MNILQERNIAVGVVALFSFVLLDPSETVTIERRRHSIELALEARCSKGSMSLEANDAVNIYEQSNANSDENQSQRMAPSTQLLINAAVNS